MLFDLHLAYLETVKGWSSEPFSFFPRCSVKANKISLFSILRGKIFKVFAGAKNSGKKETFILSD